MRDMERDFESESVDSVICDVKAVKTKSWRRKVGSEKSRGTLIVSHDESFDSGYEMWCEM